MFSTPLESSLKFLVMFILSSANAFNLDTSKILSFGHELNINHTIRNMVIHFEDASLLFYNGSTILNSVKMAEGSPEGW